MPPRRQSSVEMVQREVRRFPRARARDPEKSRVLPTRAPPRSAGLGRQLLDAPFRGCQAARRAALAWFAFVVTKPVLSP